MKKSNIVYDTISKKTVHVFLIIVPTHYLLKHNFFSFFIYFFLLVSWFVCHFNICCFLAGDSISLPLDSNWPSSIGNILSVVANRANTLNSLELEIQILYLIRKHFVSKKSNIQGKFDHMHLSMLTRDINSFLIFGTNFIYLYMCVDGRLYGLILTWMVIQIGSAWSVWFCVYLWVVFVFHGESN